MSSHPSEPAGEGEYSCAIVNMSMKIVQFRKHQFNPLVENPEIFRPFEHTALKSGIPEVGTMSSRANRYKCARTCADLLQVPVLLVSSGGNGWWPLYHAKVFPTGTSLSRQALFYAHQALSKGASIFRALVPGSMLRTH